MATTTKSTRAAGKSSRYNELKRMLEGRRRELLSEVQGKIRDVRADGNKERDVLDQGESSEVDIQEDIEFALIQMKSETLNKINEALRRLDEGTYGNCFECGDEIAEARLRAHTYTARAVDGAGNAATSSAVTVAVNIQTGGGGGPGTGYTTSGGRLFKDGSEIKLFGLNWFGLETSNHVLHGLWTGRGLADFLADFKSKGFTALRLPVSPETINPGFAITGGPGNGPDFPALGGKDGRTALEYTLAKTQAAGVFVLVDFHTCNPAQLGAGLPNGPISCPGYSQAKWLADLKTLATLSTTFTNMIGIDLDNEPHGLTWADWSALASQGGQAVLSVNPNLTIWVEGVGTASASGGLGANWGQNLFEATAISGIPANRLVFSPHSYGPSVAAQSYFSDASYPANMPGIWDTLFGHLVGQGFAVVPGEFGGHYTTSSTPAQNDKLWQDSYVSYLIAKGMKNNFYWAVNPNSGDTGGVLLDDWLTWDAGKLALLQRLMQ